jgi:hypothetical protein
MLTTDYLIIGSGAVGMGFADQLLTDTDADMIIVDRHHLPGGHWNDAYSFVRLHQPAAFYGVGSRPLGTDRIDETGFNRGYYELPSGADVLSYYGRLMQERFLPSGRITYLPMCEYLGDGRIRSLLSGAVQDVTFRKKFVTTCFDSQVPSTHTPTFEIAEELRLVTPNALPAVAAKHAHYVILGGGKTAMDVGVWLLQMGARPDRIRWIMPRDSWLMNREVTQPGEAFLLRAAGGQLKQFGAAAEAASIDDLFARLEQAGQILRIDPAVRPSKFSGATISVHEVAMLTAIKDVVRKGYVRRITRDAIVLDEGAVPSAADCLYIDCTGRAFTSRPTVPVFDGSHITVQLVRSGLTCLSAAFVAHVEAAYRDDVEKNQLCAPILLPSTDVDLLRWMLADLRNARRWGADKDLRRWVQEHRLSGAAVGPVDESARGAEADRIRAGLREVRPKAEANLVRLMATAEPRNREPNLFPR